MFVSNQRPGLEPSTILTDSSIAKNENAAVFFLVDYCNLDVPPLASYVFRRIEGGNYDAGQVVTNNRTIPIGLEIGSKAVWNGQDWDVSKN